MNIAVERNVLPTGEYVSVEFAANDKSVTKKFRMSGSVRENSLTFGKYAREAYIDLFWDGVKPL